MESSKMACTSTTSALSWSGNPKRVVESFPKILKVSLYQLNTDSPLIQKIIIITLKSKIELLICFSNNTKHCWVSVIEVPEPWLPFQSLPLRQSSILELLLFLDKPPPLLRHVFPFPCFLLSRFSPLLTVRFPLNLFLFFFANVRFKNSKLSRWVLSFIGRKIARNVLTRATEVEASVAADADTTELPEIVKTAQEAVKSFTFYKWLCSFLLLSFLW